MADMTERDRELVARHDLSYDRWRHMPEDRRAIWRALDALCRQLEEATGDGRRVHIQVADRPGWSKDWERIGELIRTGKVRVDGPYGGRLAP